MLQLAAGWQIDVDYSPDWLFMRLQGHSAREPFPPLSEALWSHAEEHGVNRLVFELGESVLLTSYVIGQLMLLHKRAHLDGGTLRVCGFTPANHQVLAMMQLAERFPNYATREDAVLGHLPRQPR
jgi:anti-anti-sigma regulatory factor